MSVLGIDPGPDQTAFALVSDDYEVLDAGKVENHLFRSRLKDYVSGMDGDVVIEGIQSYGMTVGKEVFHTCYEIGRLIQICDCKIPWRIYHRPEYSKAICGVQKVTDSVLRQALLLRFGGDKKGEPLHLLKGCTDKRSAFAIACYHLDRMRQNRAKDW